MTLCFTYFLTSTWALTFGYIKWTPDGSFTGSFFDIVLSQYVRQGMGKTFPQKTRNEFVIANFCLEISPMVEFPFDDKLLYRVWNQGIFRILLCVLSILYSPHLWVYKMDPRWFLYWEFLWYCVKSVCQARDGQNISTKNAEWVCHRQFLLGNIAHGGISVWW